jgi:hypothetical protein
MNSKFRGIPYNKLLIDFFNMYVGVAVAQSIDPTLTEKYKVLDFHNPKSDFEIIGSLIFGKTLQQRSR